MPPVHRIGGFPLDCLHRNGLNYILCESVQWVRYCETSALISIIDIVIVFLFIYLILNINEINHWRFDRKIISFTLLPVSYSPGAKAIDTSALGLSKYISTPTPVCDLDVSVYRSNFHGCSRESSLSRNTSLYLSQKQSALRATVSSCPEKVALPYSSIRLLMRALKTDSLRLSRS